MSTIRIDEERWSKLVKKELELSVQKKVYVKKSEIVNFLIDNYLDEVAIKESQLCKINFRK